MGYFSNKNMGRVRLRILYRNFDRISLKVWASPKYKKHYILSVISTWFHLSQIKKILINIQFLLTISHL